MTRATQPTLTPMMAQYLAIRAEVGADTLLLYRMGDFYEVFFRDAEVMAATLDIALTKRGKHDGRPIPMAGVPVHSSEAYIERLIKTGHAVAVCEQTEDPREARKRGPRAVVRREIIRLITPGDAVKQPEPKPEADASVEAEADAAPTTLQTEATDVGEQTLVHGVRPVTLGERLTAMTTHPMRPRRNPAAAQRPCDHGLFDEVGRAQLDILDLIDTMEDRP